MKYEILKTINGGTPPKRSTKYSAAVDLYANEDVSIEIGQTKLVGLGIVIDTQAILDKINDSDYGFGMDIKHVYEVFMASSYLQLMIRSSLSLRGLILANGVGIVDLDYPNEIKMVITNINSDDPYHVHKGDRIGQAILMSHNTGMIAVGEKVERTGGFGSTGR